MSSSTYSNFDTNNQILQNLNPIKSKNDKKINMNTDIQFLDSNENRRRQPPEKPVSNNEKKKKNCENRRTRSKVVSDIHDRKINTNKLYNSFCWRRTFLLI